MSNETTLDDVLALVAWPDFGGPIVWHDIDDDGWSIDQRKVMAAAVNYLRAHGDELRAALEDARRYRWLQENAKRLDLHGYLNLNWIEPNETEWEEIDAAIDAAQEVGRD